MANTRVNTFGTVTTSSAAIVTISTVSVGLGGRLLLTNTDTTNDLTVTINVAQDGGATAAGNTRWQTEPITATETRVFTMPAILRKGAKIYIIQDAGTGTKINYDFGVTLIPQNATSAG